MSIILPFALLKPAATVLPTQRLSGVGQYLAIGKGVLATIYYLKFNFLLLSLSYKIQINPLFVYLWD